MYGKILPGPPNSAASPSWLPEPVRILLPEFRVKQLIRIIFLITTGRFSGWIAVFSLFSGRPEIAEEVDYRSVDLGGPLLLGPVAAAGKHDRRPELGHEAREVGDQLIHAREGHNRVAVAGDVEGRDQHPRPGEGGQQFPVWVDVAVPFGAATKSGAGELAGVEVDVGLAEPGWQGRRVHKLAGPPGEQSTPARHHHRRGRAVRHVPRDRIEGGADEAADVVLELSLGDPGCLEIELIEDRVVG